MIRNRSASLFHGLLQGVWSHGTLLQAAILVSLWAVAPVVAHAQATAKKGASPTILSVLVPAGAIGNNYYVYVDRKIAARPPHKPVGQPLALMLVQTDTANEFRDANGRVLRSVNGEWDTESTTRLSDRSWRSTLGLFNLIEIAVQPGRRVIEILVLPRDSLLAERQLSARKPWLITRPLEVSVDPGQRRELVIPPPLEIDGLVALMARATGPCVGVPLASNGMPDIDWLGKRKDAYLNDPLVSAMLLVDKGKLLASNGLMRIKLPQELGGERELDEVLVPYLAKVILWRHDFPSRKSVEGCKKVSPQHASVFDQYSSTVNALREQQRQFEELATLLK